MSMKKFFYLLSLLVLYFSKAYCLDESDLVEVGRGTFGKKTICFWDASTRVKIGKFCSLGGVTIMLGGEHRTEWATTYPFSVLWREGHPFPGHPKTKGNIYIGNDVWIGMHSLILSGVKIGDGAIINPYSVVTKDVPPYTIVAGNPAKFVKYRFDRPTIDKLLAIAWWDWPDSEIIKALPYMLSDDIDKFIKYCESRNDSSL